MQEGRLKHEPYTLVSLLGGTNEVHPDVFNVLILYRYWGDKIFTIYLQKLRVHPPIMDSPVSMLVYLTPRPKNWPGICSIWDITKSLERKRVLLSVWNWSVFGTRTRNYLSQHSYLTYKNIINTIWLHFVFAENNAQIYYILVIYRDSSLVQFNNYE